MPHVLNWLYYAISWLLLRIHEVLSLALSPGGGVTWALSIIVLVVLIRLVLFPLFVKQFHSMRKMQALQPQIKALRKKFADDKQAQSRAMMELQREAGANPLGGCLPMIVQAPVFIGLYHVLRHLSPHRAALYGWTPEQMNSAVHARLFGAPIPASFKSDSAFLHSLSADPTATRIVIAVLLLFSCAATYLTQLQNYRRNSATMEPQQAGIQKLMIYIVPVGLAFSGLIFGLPLGVLLYWFANNLWTMGQQHYIMTRLQKKVEEENAAKQEAAQQGETRAPAPGVRPKRDKRGRPILATDVGPAEGTLLNGQPIDTGSQPVMPSRPARAGPTSASAPRPGQRPQNRPNRKKKRR